MQGKDETTPNNPHGLKIPRVTLEQSFRQTTFLSLLHKGRENWSLDDTKKARSLLSEITQYVGTEEIISNNNSGDEHEGFSDEVPTFSQPEKEKEVDKVREEDKENNAPAQQNEPSTPKKADKKPVAKRKPTVAAQIEQIVRCPVAESKKNMKKDLKSDIGGSNTPISKAEKRTYQKAFFSPGGSTMFVERKVTLRVKKTNGGSFVPEPTTPKNN